MKLTLADLGQSTFKTVLPFYWLVGDDFSLQQEALERLILSAQQNGYAEIERLALEAKSDFSSIYFKLQTNNLFCAKRVMCLSLGTAKLTSAAKQGLQKYVENPNPNLLLILISGKSIKTDLEKTIVPLIEQHGAIVTLWPLSPNEITIWLRHSAAQHGFSLNGEATALLQQYHQNNLAALKQTLAQLALLFNQQQELSVPDILPVLTDNSEYTVFDLARVVMLGDIKATVNMLRHLRQHDAEPLLALWSLQQEIKDLLYLHEQMPQQSLTSLFTKRRIWTQRQTGVKAALKRHDNQSCRQLLLQASRVDASLKGACVDSGWLALANLAYALADRSYPLIY